MGCTKLTFFFFFFLILHRASEDTALLFLKEIYRTMNINPEQPQHWCMGAWICKFVLIWLKFLLQSQRQLRSVYFPLFLWSLNYEAVNCKVCDFDLEKNIYIFKCRGSLRVLPSLPFPKGIWYSSWYDVIVASTTLKCDLFLP